MRGAIIAAVIVVIVVLVIAHMSSSSNTISAILAATKKDDPPPTLIDSSAAAKQHDADVLAALEGAAVSCDGKIYKIENGKKRGYSDLAYRIDGKPSIIENCDVLNKIAPGVDMPTTMPPELQSAIAEILQSDDVRCADTYRVYRIDGHVKRLFTADSFASYGSPQSVNVDCNALDFVPDGPPMPVLPIGLIISAEMQKLRGRYARCSTTGTIYYINNDGKYALSAEEYVRRARPAHIDVDCVILDAIRNVAHH